MQDSFASSVHIGLPLDESTDSFDSLKTQPLNGDAPLVINFLYFFEYSPFSNFLIKMFFLNKKHLCRLHHHLKKVVPLMK